MPNKDDEDCECTGSINLEKTTKNINLNISKEQNNKKYTNESDCKIAAIIRYKKPYNCEQFCKLESKRLYQEKMNCYDLRLRNNKEYDEGIKQARCKSEAKILFGASTKIQNCDQLAEAKADIINKLCLKLENRRFNHMFRRKYTKNGKIALVEDGFKIEFNAVSTFDDGSPLFIQTYDKGNKSLWQVNNTYNKALKGRIKSYNSYKEFLIDYFKSPEIFKFNNNNKKYNAKNLKQILDVVGSFAGEERLDFDLEENFFEGCTSLIKIIITNLSTGEQIQPDYDNYNYEFNGISYDNMINPFKLKPEKDEWYRYDRRTRNPIYIYLLLHLLDSNSFYFEENSPNKNELIKRYKEKNPVITTYGKTSDYGEAKETTPIMGTAEYSADEWQAYPNVKGWVRDINHLMKIHEKKISISFDYKNKDGIWYCVHNAKELYDAVTAAKYKNRGTIEFKSLSEYFTFLYNWIINDVDHEYFQYNYNNRKHQFREPFGTKIVDRDGKKIVKYLIHIYDNNWDELMKFFKDTYNTQDITQKEYKKYWGKRLNYTSEFFSMGVNAFHGCKKLEEVRLTSEKIKLGSTFDNYFSGLQNLKIVHLNDNVTYIGRKTFSGCKNLKEVFIPELKSIGELAFEDCENLTEYTIEKNVSYIHPTAFKGCNNLNKLNIKTSHDNFTEIFKDNITIFSKNNIHIIEFDKNTYENSIWLEPKEPLYINLNKTFENNFKSSLKRIIYPKIEMRKLDDEEEDKVIDELIEYAKESSINLIGIPNIVINFFNSNNKNIFGFDANRRFEYNNRYYTYYNYLSQLPNYLIKDLSIEELDGVKTFDLNINPSKLPPNYFTLKTINNKYTIIGPGVKLNSASLNLKNYDLNNLNINNNLMSIFNTLKFNTYEIVYEQTSTLPENYVLKVNRENKKMIIGPGVNLTNADLTDVNLNGIDITNINFKNAIFNNVIAANVKIDNNSTNNGYKVFKKNKQKFLLGPGLYFDKFDFSSMNFQELKLNNSIFRNCNFTNVDLRKAYLTNCSLINCNLTNALLNNLTTLKGLKSNALTYNGVNFKNEKKYKIYGNNGNGILIGPKVDLSNQNLSNLDLSRANMTQVIIHKTIINDNTKLPKKVDKSKFIVVKS